MKTTANSLNSKGRTPSSQGNREKYSKDISLASKNYIQINNNNKSPKHNNIVHPYIERITNHSQSQLSQTRDNNMRINNSNIKQRTKSKDLFDIKNIKASNQKDFLFSLNNDCSFIQRALHESNKVELLEKMIVSIKEQTVTKFNDDLNEKLNIKESLEKSIEDYKKHIYQLSNEKKFQIKSKLATRKQIDAYRSRLADNNSLLLHENNPDAIKAEIENYKRETERNKAETKEINNAIAQENNHIKEIQEMMKRMNKSISDKKKEKINFYPAITLMQKHIQAIQTKIKAQLRSNNEMTHKMTSIIENNF